MNNSVDQSTGKVEGQDELMSRRAFSQALFTGVGICYVAAIGYPVYQYLASPINRANEAATVNQISLPNANTLEKGSSMMFKFGTKPCILIHHTDDTWVSMEAVCTHLGCTVQYQAQQNRLFCACHNGVYDTRTGANVSGPPPKPLTAFKVSVEQDSVVISKS